MLLHNGTYLLIDFIRTQLRAITSKQYTSLTWRLQKLPITKLHVVDYICIAMHDVTRDNGRHGDK